MKAPEEILLDEFGCYYLADEIGVGQQFLSRLDEFASDSAVRLVEEAGPSGIGGVVELLERLRDERSHPLHDAIAAASLICWNEDDYMLGIFRQFVDALVAKLRAAASRAGDLPLG